MTEKIQTSISETEDKLLRKMSVLEDNLSDFEKCHGFLDGQSLNNYSNPGARVFITFFFVNFPYDHVTRNTLFGAFRRNLWNQVCNLSITNVLLNVKSIQSSLPVIS